MFPYPPLGDALNSSVGLTLGNFYQCPVHGRGRIDITVVDANCIDRCKLKYHTITVTTVTFVLVCICSLLM